LVAVTSGVNPPKPAPKGLKPRGRALWRAVFAIYSLNPAEELILHELCRVADRLDCLNAELDAAEPVVRGSEGQPRAHPLFATVVEWEKVAELLSRRLALPDDHLLVKRSASAARSANARWAGARVKGV
jgi:hypothetical protein